MLKKKRERQKLITVAEEFDYCTKPAEKKIKTKTRETITLLSTLLPYAHSNAFIINRRHLRSGEKIRNF